MTTPVTGAHAHLDSHGDEHAHHAQSFFHKYLWSTDHKMIAMQYLFTGAVMALIGGYLAYVFRMQLAFPGRDVPGYGLVTPGKYNALVTMHGSIMIFWVAMPVLVAAFGNFLIPLMIGCDDMVFPADQSPLLPGFSAERPHSARFILRAQRRVRGRLDFLSSAFG